VRGCCGNYNWKLELADGIGGVDLNLRLKGFAEGLGSWLPRRTDARRQDPFRAGDGFSSLDDFRSDREAVRRRQSCANTVLYRAVSLHGVCAADVSREFARYRGVLGGASREAVPHGPSSASSSLYAGRSKRIARLAHLRGVCAPADRPRARALRGGFLWSGLGQHRVRAGCDDHRSVPGRPTTSLPSIC